MEDQFRKRVAKRLDSFERKSKEWEWSDLLRWLKSLKDVIDKYQGSVLDNELLPSLGKRLAQCLNPHLTQGLHTKTLEIYKAIMLSAPIDQFPLFSAGLFPFFQYCSPQNKGQFLDLIDQIYVPRITELRHALGGLVACLFSGAGDKQEVFNTVAEIIDKCSQVLPQQTNSAIWGFIMRSSRHRAPALLYVYKRMTPDMKTSQAVEALMAALNDSQVVIRRQALDVIKTHFQLNSPEISDWDKVLLAKEALKLLQTRDQTLMRRLWDWAFPEEPDSGAVEVVTNAIQQIFLEVQYYLHREIDQDKWKVAIIKILEVLLDNELVGDKVMEKVGIDFVRHIVEEDLCYIHGKQDQRVELIFRDEKAAGFWRAFEVHLVETLDVDLEDCLKILNFAIDKIEHTSSDLLPVLDVLLLNLSEDCVLQCIKLAERLESLPSAAVKACELFGDLLKNPQKDKEFLRNLSFLLGKLSKLGLETDSHSDTLLSLVFHREIELLWGLELLCNLGSSAVPVEGLKKLWKSLDSKANTRVVHLLVAFYSLNPSRWNLCLSELLTHSNLHKRLEFMKSYLFYWKALSKSPDTLRSTLTEGESVLIMVQHLKDPFPPVRYIAKTWLSTAMKTVSCLLDPLLSVYFHSKTVRDSQMAYQTSYDTRRALSIIQHFKNLLEEGEAQLKAEMDQKVLSSSVYLEMHGFVPGTYLEVILEGTLAYVRAESQFDYQENKTVQAAACDLLSILVKQIAPPLALSALEVCSVCLYKAVEAKDSVLQYLLIQCMYSIFMNTEISTQPELLEVSLKKPEFFNSVLNGLHTKDPYLRTNWSVFISYILPLLSDLLSHPVVTHYFSSLLHSYVELIKQTQDFSLLSGLRVLIHEALGINSKNPNSKKHPQVEEVLFREMGSVIDLAMFCFEHSEKDSSAQKQSVQDQVFEIFAPVPYRFLIKFVKSITSLWKEFLPSQKSSMKTLCRILPFLGLNVEMVLDGVLKDLERFFDSTHKKLSLTHGSEVHLCHFLYGVLWHSSHLSSRQSTANLSPYFPRVLRILTILSNSAWDETTYFLIATLHLFYKTIPVFKLEKKVKKELQDLVEQLFQKTCFSTLKWDREAFKIEYPGLAFKDYKVNEVALISLRDFGFDVACFAFHTEKTKLVIERCTLGFIEGMPRASVAVDLASQVVLNFIEKSDEVTTKEVTKAVFEFVTSQGFLPICSAFPGTFKTWAAIINWVGTHSYPEKHLLLSHVLNKFQSGFLSSTSQVKHDFAMSILMSAFIVYSGSENDYKESIVAIEEMLSKALKKAELVEVCLLLVRVLVLRFDQVLFKRIWVRSWPDLNLITQQALLFNEDPKSTLAVLKFLDQFVAMGQQDIHEVLWISLFDVTEIELKLGNPDRFLPFISKGFLKGYTAKPKKVRREEEKVGTLIKREMHLVGSKASTSEELDMHVKTLIQYSIFYNSEIATVNWESIDQAIQQDFIIAFEAINS